MKTYPSIPGPHGYPKQSSHIFVKYDGSSIRAEWSKKRGWYKFGTRKQLLDPDHPVFGPAIPLFLDKYADELARIFLSEKSLRGTDQAIVFFEFFGAGTFAGMHLPDPEQLWDVVLFDVNPHKKGMLGPMEFLDLFGHMPVAELICEAVVDDDFVQSVRTESIPLESQFACRTEVPEGVICKSGRSHQLITCKIKTERYRDELKKRYQDDWMKHWE